jgi:hypothetical protein
MNGHLKQHEIDAVLAGSEIPAAATAHLESCLVCRRAIAEFEELVAERKRALMQDAPDWDRQRERILERVAAPHAVAVLRPRRRARVWIAAAAAVVLGVGIAAMRFVSAPVPEPQEIPVEQILAEADALLDGNAVPGYELIDPFINDTSQAELEHENGAS